MTTTTITEQEDLGQCHRRCGRDATRIVHVDDSKLEMSPCGSFGELTGFGYMMRLCAVCTEIDPPTLDLPHELVRTVKKRPNPKGDA